jgi:dihydrofolate reductase
MFISIIAAMDRNRIIGQDNQMPWHLPADFKHFKNITMGKPIVMGRKTYDSIGRALPGRRNIIISRNLSLQIPDCEVVNSLVEALLLLKQEEEVFIIGGADLFTQALPFTDRLYFTLIEREFAGDTYFPNWQAEDWQEISRVSYEADAKNMYDYHFRILNRISPKKKLGKLG